MSCHNQGMIFKNDQVRDAVLKTEAGYAVDELCPRSKRLIPPREEFDKILQDDAARLQRKRLEATGTKANAPEPIEGLSPAFQRRKWTCGLPPLRLPA